MGEHRYKLSYRRGQESIEAGEMTSEQYEALVKTGFAEPSPAQRRLSAVPEAARGQYTAVLKALDDFNAAAKGEVTLRLQMLTK